MAGFQLDVDILEDLHGGRPKDEEPHVKRSVSKKGKDGIEYLLRVDLEELEISEEEFDDLQSLFELFDNDKDGVLNLKEFQVMIRCLGIHLTSEQAQKFVSGVSCDSLHFSVSFNEYLKLVSNERRSDPSEGTLLQMFQSLDPDNSGYITEGKLRKILKGKIGISEEDTEEMITEYKKLGIQQASTEKEPIIFYKDFVGMLKI